MRSHELPDEQDRRHLGPAVNTKPLSSGLQPIIGRPNWFTDGKGRPRYVEPPRPVAP